MNRPLRLGVLLSGTGRTFQNFLELRKRGSLAIDPVCVISSKPGVRGLEFAREAGVPALVRRPREFKGPRAYGEELGTVLLEHEVELVAMAGFLHLWEIPAAFEDRVMNIHPALLPAFGGKGYYGDRVHQAVLDAGVKISGCTVHFADNEYDHGPIILQRSAPVLDDDDAHSLAARVFEQECIAYPEAVRLFAAGRLRRSGRRVLTLPD